MLVSNAWKDYELIDANEGERLERWGDIILIRPDPQIIWRISDSDKSPLWEKSDARYMRSRSGGGFWEFYKTLPDGWNISYKNLTFAVKPTGFKHTGLFPEQAANWDYITEKIKNRRSPVRVLNLFAYTGGATMAAAAAGASVCHLDASKGMVLWAKDNARLCGLGSHPIRYLVDDVKKFVERELRRGNKYDAIIMDPPSYGRGPGGEMWKIEDELFRLVEQCTELLSNSPLFFILNSYTTGLSATAAANVLSLTCTRRFGGSVEWDEIGLPITSRNIILPCGAAARWTGSY